MELFGDVASTDPHEIWTGVLGRVVWGENVTLSVIELDADALIPEHRHVNEQVGVCVKGSLEFRIGDDRRRLQPGALWRIPPDVPHEVKVGPDGAVVVEAFAPARADWSVLEQRPGATPRWPA